MGTEMGTEMGMGGQRLTHAVAGPCVLVWMLAGACGGDDDTGTDPEGLFDAATTAYADGASLRPDIPVMDGDDPVLVACSTATPSAGGDAIATTFDVCYRTPGGVTAIRATEGEDRFWTVTPVTSVPEGATVRAVRYLLGRAVDDQTSPAIPHDLAVFTAPANGLVPPPSPSLLPSWSRQPVSPDGVDPAQRRCAEESLWQPIVVPPGEILWVAHQQRLVAGLSYAIVACDVPEGFEAPTYYSQGTDEPFDWTTGGEPFGLFSTFWIEVEYSSP